MRLRAACGLLAALGIAACAGDDGAPTATRFLELVSGDSQAVTVMTSSVPLVVRVVDDAGAPMAGVAVDFAVTSDGGPGRGASTARDTTDADGLASAVYTAGPDAGTRHVRARLDREHLDFTVRATAGSAAAMVMMQGEGQGANVNSLLPIRLGARVEDGFGNAVPGVPVAWSVVFGGGAVTADTTLTDAFGLATVGLTLGSAGGGKFVQASTAGVPDTLLFHATARRPMTVLAGGDNVPGRCTSDLWVTAAYAYTGTWGNCGGVGARVLNVWDVSSGVTFLDTLHVAAGTLSDNEVSADGTLLLVTAEGGGGSNGLYIYSLGDPAHPALVGFELVSAGLHTGTFAEIGGQRYVFASKDPGGGPALMGFRVQPDSADTIVPLWSLPQGGLAMHDQFYRDGLLFASVWDNGLKIYDVGDGRAGGGPTAPQQIGSIVTAARGLTCNCVHNAWWYHDAQGGKRYVFVGQEGPGTPRSSSSGDLHVVDVSNMAAPKEVAFYHMADAGVHNFWMDEARGILYAAYYNGGIVALDVTGTLSGDLASREIARITPGGPGNTYVWGVMLANGALYASDMVSGLWKVAVP